MMKIARFFVIVLLLQPALYAADTDTETDLIQVDPAPGSYSRDITVSLKGPDSLNYRFLESCDDAFCPYLLPFHITALPGEERVYNILIQSTGGEKKVSFTIDKKRPEAPLADVAPGTYNHDITVSFSSPEGESVYAAVDSLPTGPVPEGGIQLEQDRLEDRSYTIFAYTKDRAGNTSPLTSFTYIIRKSYRAESFLSIHSPVAGTFSNMQLLTCNISGFEWIRYSLDDKDPAEMGIEYVSPVLIDRTGSVRVRIAAKPAGSDDIIRKEVQYTVLDNEPLNAIPAQGLSAEALTIPPQGRDFFYTLDDSLPEADDTPLDNSLRLLPVDGTSKAYILRVRKPENSGGSIGSSYRYVYVIDPRVPVKPVIRISADSPVSKAVDVTIEAGERTEIFYSIDGRTPDRRSAVYKGPFTIPLPENIGFGSIIIKAAAYGINGKKSPEASLLFTFDRDPPETPNITMSGPLDNGSFRFTGDPGYGTRLVYEMSHEGLDPVIPGAESPDFENSLLLQVPYGMDKNFLFRFAAMDEAGNISVPTEIYSAHLDRLPPPPPEITLDETGLVLDTPWQAYYRIYREDVGSQSETSGEFIPYQKTVSLEVPEEESVTYRAEAYAVDDNNNRSGTVSASFSRDAGTIRPPRFFGLEKSRLFNSQEVSLRVSPASASDVVRYTFTKNGEAPPVPGQESPRAGSVITFEGVQDAEVLIQFKLMSFSSDGTRSSDPVEGSFTIDLLKPGIPVLQGFENGGIYNSAVSFTADSEKEDTVFFSMTSEESIPPDPFGPEGSPLTDTYTIPAIEGLEKEYRIRLGSVDRAGNRALNETMYSVIIDKEYPVLPEPLGLPLKGRTTGNVHISFPPFNGKILYTLSTDGSIPPEPDETSRIYREHIVLHGEPGKEITYTLRTACVDSAGNKGRVSRVYRCVIDQKAPVVPPEPAIQISKQRVSIIVSWQESTPDTVVFRVPEIQDTWYAYTGPLSFKLPETQNTITVEYYAKDEAGNTSNKRNIRISLPFSSSTPLFTGVEDGGIYKANVTLFKSAGSSLCRYEIGIDNETAPPVSEFSPEMPDSITLKAVEGETVRYTIRVKLYPENGAESIQREQTAGFIIDNDPPAPPVVDGIRDGVFYQDDRTISFSSPEGIIRYAVAPEGQPRIDLDTFEEYTRPVALQTEEGSFSSFTVYAYVVDKAGNRSSVRDWNISIDKEIIYVSEKGNDGYDGTRTHPFRTIQKAFEHSAQTGRRSIYIAGGYYPIDGTMEIPEGIVISGGYSDDEWKREQTGETVFLPGTFFAGDEPMFLIKSGRNTLKNIRIYDTSGLASALIRVSSGECTVTQSILERTGSGTGTVIQHGKGTLYINDSEIRVSRSSGASALEITGGTVFISDSLFKGSNTAGDMTLLSVQDDGRVLAGRSSFLPGEGRKTTAFYAENSSIILTECTVSTGTGRVLASAFNLQGSILECAASSISGESGSRISTTVVARNSEVTLYNSLLHIDAFLGAVGIRAAGSVVNIATSSIETEETEEFVYLFRLENSYGYFYTNHMTGKTSDDFAVMRITGGSLKWYCNTCMFAGGLDRSVCFETYEEPSLSIVNSIMIQKNASTTGAFYQGAGIKGLECLSNNIYGWGVVSETDDGLTADVELFDTTDGNPLGGSLNGNIAEDPSETFTVSKSDEFRLKPTSNCVNNGFDVRPLGGPDRDREGQIRPNPYHGIKPAYDIGSDEYYE